MQYYFTELMNIKNEEIKEIQDKLNTRPRKVLGLLSSVSNLIIVKIIYSII